MSKTIKIKKNNNYLKFVYIINYNLYNITVYITFIGLKCTHFIFWRLRRNGITFCNKISMTKYQMFTNVFINFA